MFSPGTGAPITPQDALDLLHKLATEVTKVQVSFTCAGCGVSVAARGFLKIAPNGTFGIVREDESPASVLLTFDPSLAVRRTYGDERSMPEGNTTPGGLRLASALCFLFPDGSSLALFEVGEE